MNKAEERATKKFYEPCAEDGRSKYCCIFCGKTLVRYDIGRKNRKQKEKMESHIYKKHGDSERFRLRVVEVEHALEREEAEYRRVYERSVARHNRKVKEKIARMRKRENIDEFSALEVTLLRGDVFSLAVVLVKSWGEDRMGTPAYAYVSTMKDDVGNRIPHRMITSMYAGGLTGNGTHAGDILDYDPATGRFADRYTFSCFV